MLCGIPLDDPLPSSIDITEQEQEMAEQIIRAVTQNWPSMNSTTNDSFRVTFLHRPGELFSKGGDWLLRVERQTFDFFLETIPWGFTTVKMKQMDRVLNVEWQGI